MTVTKTTLSIAQLVFFNTTPKTPNANRTEAPLPVYIGLYVHSRFSSGEIVDVLARLGLSVNYHRVMEKNIGLFVIQQFTDEGARFVKHRYHNRSSVTDLLEDLKWKSLETRRKESRLTKMYKIVNQQVAIDPDKHLMKPQKQSRSANTNSYVVPYASTTSSQQSFFPRTIRDWNQLPLSIKKAGSVSAFKAQLATYFAKLSLPLIPLSDPHPTANNVPLSLPLSLSFSTLSFSFSLSFFLSLFLARKLPPWQNIKIVECGQ